MLKLLNVLELLECFGLCCAALWCESVGVVAECIGLFGIV